MSRLTVGCEVCRRSAARVRWPVRITASKTSIRRWLSGAGMSSSIASWPLHIRSEWLTDKKALD